MGDEFRAESLLSTVGVDWDTKAIVVDGVNVTMKIWVRPIGLALSSNEPHYRFSIPFPQHWH